MAAFEDMKSQDGVVNKLQENGNVVLKLISLTYFGSELVND